MFNPFPTTPVYSQVGWSYNGALYCTDHEPEPYLYRTMGDLVQPVLLADVTADDVCDDCGEFLDGGSVYANMHDPLYTPDEHGALDSLYFGVDY